METAYCTLDKNTYEADVFAAFSPTEIASKRYSLECVECKAEAYFNKGAKGKSPYFGARKHVGDCSVARGNLSTSLDSEIMIAGRIVLTLGSQAKEKSPLGPTVKAVSKSRTVVQLAGSGKSSGKTVKRDLDELLDALVSTPEFQHSSQLIVVNGNAVPASNLFVRMEDVTHEHTGLFRAFWGKISIAADGNGGLTWLNMDKDKPTAVYIRADLFTEAQARWGFDRTSELNDAYILFLGEFPMGLKANVKDMDYISVRRSKHTLKT